MWLGTHNLGFSMGDKWFTSDKSTWFLEALGLTLAVSRFISHSVASQLLYKWKLTNLKTSEENFQVSSCQPRNFCLCTSILAHE